MWSLLDRFSGYLTPRKECRLVFRSTDYDARMLDFRMKCALEQSNIEVSNVSAEWVILNTDFEKHISFTESGDAFNEMHFIYSIQRMPAFYVLNMIVPIVLMFFLSIFVFYLPTVMDFHTYRLKSN